MVDLSTNDHIPDYERALAEYARVLAPGGRVLVVTWLTNGEAEPRKVGGVESDTQYWFDAAEFRESFERWFSVEEEFRFPEHSGQRWLQGFAGAKR